MTTPKHGPAGARCGLCGATTPTGRTFCGRCHDHISEAVGAYWWRAPTPYGPAPNLLDELQTTMTRQARIAVASNGSRPTERPLPFHVLAAEAYRDDAWWLRDEARHAGAPGIIFRLRNPVVSARWLWTNLNTILGGPRGAAFADAALYRHRRALMIIDRPPETWFAGPCTCGADLYAEDRATTIRCHACGHAYDVAAQRAKLLAGVEDVLATTTEICRAIGLLDRPITRSQIDNWHARGQLTRRGRSPGGHHLYRVGDVLDLLARRSA